MSVAAALVAEQAPAIFEAHASRTKTAAERVLQIQSDSRRRSPSGSQFSGGAANFLGFFTGCKRLRHTRISA
jgi:hypothetical protein